MNDKKDSRFNQIANPSPDAEGFLGGSHIAFVFKKAERLATAVYLISNLWDDREPLKWTLRDRNLSLLEMSSKYHYGRMLDWTHVGREMLSRIAEIISLLEISFASGLVSEMNLRLIKEQYLYLIKLIEGREADLLLLPKNFFDNKDEEVNYLRSAESGLSRSRSGGSAEYGSKGHKRHVSENKVSLTGRKEAGPKVPALSENASSGRRETILALVRSRGEITVKDAVTVIKGYSEKTIQRELIALTAAGLLKKKGERRWSKYSIK
jgi:DNA-binding transcriptional ArsR family regulator